MRGYGYGGLRAWLDDLSYRIQLQERDHFDAVLRIWEIDRADYTLLYDVNYETGIDRLGRTAP